MRARAGGDGERAQTATIGIVLVFGIMLMGASVVVVFGVGAIEDSQQGLSVERAEKALTQLDSKAALVALGNTDTQTVSFARSGDDQFTVENGTGWMNVTIDNTTDANPPVNLVNQSLGSVVYQNGDDEIAYQGGGVWRSSREGQSVMVSPPEFHFRNGTLTLPVLNLTGDASLGNGASVTHTETIRKFPDRSATDRDNPLDQHRVELVVQSDHYEAWGKYFEERTDGNVEYDHSEDKVFLELVSPIGLTQVNAATASYAPNSKFEIDGTSGNPCSGGPDVYTDSYNSSGTSDNYCDQHSALPVRLTEDKGNITYGRDIDLSAGTGNALINGSVKSGGSVIVGSAGDNDCEEDGGQPDICGDIFYTDSCSPDVPTCESRQPPGQITDQIAGFASKTPINGIIDSTESDLSGSNNNNGDTPNVSSHAVNFGAVGPSDHATLPAGSYHLNDIDMGGNDNLTLDTSGGNIKIAVRDYIDLDNGDTIHVAGDGIVRIYIKGENPNSIGGQDVMLHLDRADVHVPGDDAPQLRVYGKDDFNVTITGGGGGNHAEFTGVLFAPPGAAGTGEIDIDHGSVRGGVVTGDTTLFTQGQIHYDEALKNRQIISRDAKVVKVTYLHVTINRIHVAGG